MILEELFSTVAEFRKYAPSAESNISFQVLNPSASSAKKQIVILLTRDVYALIAQKESELKDALRTALANLTLGKQLIFDVISRRKSDIDIYKHEQEAMRRAYIDNYYTAMDTSSCSKNRRKCHNNGKTLSIIRCLSHCVSRAPKSSTHFIQSTCHTSSSSEQPLFRRKPSRKDYHLTMIVQNCGRIFL